MIDRLNQRVREVGRSRQTAPVSTTLYYERDPSGRLLALTDGTTAYYYGLDGHGSMVNVTDRSGVVQNAYRYDPYGNSLAKAENATLSNPWQYAGGYWDAETGLYLLGARYYAPRLGRFLQQDPLGGGGESQYAYAGSNPCNNSDPTGMKTCYQYISGATAQEDARSLDTQIYDLQSSISTVTSVSGPLAVGGGAGIGAVIGGMTCGVPCAVGGAIIGAAGGAIVEDVEIGPANDDLNQLQELRSWLSDSSISGTYYAFSSNVFGGCFSGDLTTRPSSAIPDNINQLFIDNFGYQ